YRKASELRRIESCLTALRVSCSRMCGGVVHKVFQFLAGLEIRNFLGTHFHFFSGLRIAPHASSALASAEAAEAANLDLFTLLQSRDDVVEYRFDDHSAFLASNLGDVQDFLLQIAFREGQCRLFIQFATPRGTC